MTPPQSEPQREQESVHFVLDLGRALHQLGHPSHWLEEGMQHASRKLGLIGHFFTTPTSVFAAFGDQAHQRTYLLRVEPGDVHLERLARVIAIGRAVLAGRMAPAEGSHALRAILLSPARFGPVPTTLAFALSGAAACRFLGGGLTEVLAAAALGAVLSATSMLAARMPTLQRLFEPIAAFVVSACATALAREFPLSVYVTTVAAILILLPGLTITTAMAELSNQHLVSGTARLTGAGMRFLGLAFGVAVGSRAAGWLVGMPPHVTPSPLPAWTEYLALALAPLAFTILLRARPRDLPWIAGTGAGAFFAGRLATHALGPELGAFTGAFVASALSNLIARQRGGSPATTLVPGILLLVPGSVGFRSLTLMFNRDVVSGVEAAFRMFVMIAALVAGLLFASTLVRAPGLAEEPREPEDTRG
ncbi:MAG: threonine/serine exporter family protein [Candidatus Eisenbacteria bacterium]